MVLLCQVMQQVSCSCGFTLPGDATDVFVLVVLPGDAAGVFVPVVLPGDATGVFVLVVLPGDATGVFVLVVLPGDAAGDSVFVAVHGDAVGCRRCGGCGGDVGVQPLADFVAGRCGRGSVKRRERFSW